jgi:hypothetical protein
MDQRTLDHLDRWLNSEMSRLPEHTRTKFRKVMIAVYNEDPDHWGNTSWWRCFDEATFRIEREAIRESQV